MGMSRSPGGGRTADQRNRETTLRTVFRYHPDPRHETLLWSGSTIQFGTFRANAADPEFATAGQIRCYPTVVFPRSDAIWIELDGHTPFIADQGCVVLYDLHREYRRQSPTGGGDRADFFHFGEGVLLEALELSAWPRAGAGGRLFASPRQPVDDVSCALERAIVRHVQEVETPDSFLVEETMLGVLRRIFGATGPECGRGVPKRHRELAEEARALLAATVTEAHRLEELSARLGCSVFHLCRVFRAVTGSTLHSHRLRLRLRASLERVAVPGEGLSAIAYDLGFSSHSHFTGCFRRTFGLTPSTLRRRATPETVRDLTARVAEVKA